MTWRELIARSPSALKGGTLSVSWGESGGFYWFHGKEATRLCLGPVAFTYLPYDLDIVLELAAKSSPGSGVRVGPESYH